MIIFSFYLSKLTTNTIMISFSSNQKVNFMIPFFVPDSTKHDIFQVKFMDWLPLHQPTTGMQTSSNHLIKHYPSFWYKINFNSQLWKQVILLKKRLFHIEGNWHDGNNQIVLDTMMHKYKWTTDDFWHELIVK